MGINLSSSFCPVSDATVAGTLLETTSQCNFPSFAQNLQIILRSRLSAEVAVRVTAPPAAGSIGGLQKLPLGSALNLIQFSGAVCGEIGSLYLATLRYLCGQRYLSSPIPRLNGPSRSHVSRIPLFARVASNINLQFERCVVPIFLTPTHTVFMTLMELKLLVST